MNIAVPNVNVVTSSSCITKPLFLQVLNMFREKHSIKNQQVWNNFQMTVKRSPGRPRSSTSDRAQQILQAAGRLFADLGYDKTTIRLVAESAGVDPKLVMHYFGNKQRLFIATVKVPREVGKAIALLKLAPKSTWGKKNLGGDLDSSEIRLYTNTRWGYSSECLRTRSR